MYNVFVITDDVSEEPEVSFTDSISDKELNATI